MINDVLILGGGSAGFLTALMLKTRLPELSVAVVRSREIGVIGVGEATTVALPRTLHHHLGIDPGEFYREVQTTWKHGIRFLWGPRPYFDYTFSNQLDWKWSNLSRSNGYYADRDFSDVDLFSALMSRNKGFARRPDGRPQVLLNGYHIENEKFVAYIERKAARLGVAVLDETVAEVLTGPAGVAGLRIENGPVRRADLYVDCSGFRSALLGRALGEPYTSFRTTLFNDRAVTGGWRRTGEPIQPYTTAEAMAAGWCWQIDHLDRINRGYVYSSAFVTDEDAEREFRAKNPKVTDTRLVKFVTGRYHRSWVKNVVGIGNSSGFVEPLESTGLAVICDETRLLADCLVEGQRRPPQSLVDLYNRVIGTEWDLIRNFLGVHFKFNTRYDTPYWRACRADADIGDAQAVVEFYQENGPCLFAKSALIHKNDIFGLEGYLCLLLGQKVPFSHPPAFPAAEWKLWDGIRAENRVRAVTALDPVAAYRAVTDPEWQWDLSLFRP